jgi:hypothetical protein
VVRAPPIQATTGIFSIPKRHGRSTGDPEPRWQSRLSTIPSEFIEPKISSKPSSFGEERDGSSVTSSTFAASCTYLTVNPQADSSQIRIVQDLELEGEDPEASDEVSALPRLEYQYRSPPAQARSANFLGMSSSSSNSGSRLNSVRNSIDNRLNSMRSFANSRQNSLHSSSQRPGSSSSIVSNFQSPTWARRYHSGMHRDSFQYMYSSTQVTSSGPSQPASGRPSITYSHGTEASQRGVKQRVLNAIHRPRLEARRSNLEPRVGPLVSNPVRLRPPPPASTHSYEEKIPAQFAPSDHQRNLEAQSITTNRIVSLHPADPRAHCAGISPALSHMQHLQQHASREAPPSRQSSLIPRRLRASEWSPHLHIDARSS